MYLVSISGTCIFSKSISIYQSKFGDCFQIHVSLAMSSYWISEYIRFNMLLLLCLISRLETNCRLTLCNWQTEDWLTVHNSQTFRVAAYNLQIVRLTDHKSHIVWLQPADSQLQGMACKVSLFLYWFHFSFPSL